MNDYSVSDEKLNAYIDNELASEERADVITAIRQSPELSRQANDLTELKEWVRIAYQDPPQIQDSSITRQGISSIRFKSLAASVLILLSGLTGWFLHTPDTGRSSPSFHDLAAADSIIQNKRKVLIHISKMDTARINQTLDKTEQLLHNSRLKDTPLQLEVVANAQGIALLREGSPFGKRIESIANQYDNVAFLACGIAMQNIRLSEGIDEVKLLPQAQQIDAALEQILRRLKAGWAYVKA